MLSGLNCLLISFKLGPTGFFSKQELPSIKKVFPKFSPIVELLFKKLQKIGGCGVQSVIQMPFFKTNILIVYLGCLLKGIFFVLVVLLFHLFFFVCEK